MRNTLVMMATACLALAACDQNSKSNDVTVKGQNGSVTVSANGQNFTMKANDDKNGSFTMSANGGRFTMKASDGKQNVEINASGGGDLHLPDYVSVYPGAKVKSTTIDSRANSTGGAFSFETTDSPARVIAWYKQKSAGAGLAQALDMNGGATSVFSATAGAGRKALQVIAASSGTGARVQVNWSGK